VLVRASISEETPVERCRISMRRDPPHPDADAIANDGKDEHSEYDSPNADFFADLHVFHGAPPRLEQRPALKTYYRGKRSARVTPCLWTL
jgi:hypothetical protein